MKKSIQVFYSEKENIIIDYVTSENKGVYGGKDLEHYQTHGYTDAEIVDVENAIKMYCTQHITAPKEISSERYYDLLGAVPPMKYFTFCNINGFILGERIAMDIVKYCIHDLETDLYLEFQDIMLLSNDEIIKKIEGFKHEN